MAQYSQSGIIYVLETSGFVKFLGRGLWKSRQGARTLSQFDAAAQGGR